MMHKIATCTYIGCIYIYIICMFVIKFCHFANLTGPFKPQEAREIPLNFRKLPRLVMFTPLKTNGYPLKNDGWFRCISYSNSPWFWGRIRLFSGVYHSRATPTFEGNPSSDTSIFKGQGPPKQGRKSDQNKGLNWVTGIHIYVQYFDWILENRWFLVLMEEILHRLGCIKPGNGLNYQPQLVSRIFSINSMYCLVISPLLKPNVFDWRAPSAIFKNHMTRRDLTWCFSSGGVLLQVCLYIYISLKY